MVWTNFRVADTGVEEFGLHNSVRGNAVKCPADTLRLLTGNFRVGHIGPTAEPTNRSLTP
jgi:hypothetical protein